MPISAVDAITPAFQHAKQQLFQPFRFWQWTRLAIVGLLAGELGSGSGCNPSSFANFPRNPGGTSRFLMPDLSAPNLAVYAGLIAILVVAAFVLGILLMYIGSVMRFILFDSILAKECHIREGWGARQGPGWRYFLWKLFYLLLTLTGMAVIIGIPAAFAYAMGWFNRTDIYIVPLILGGVVVGFAFLIFVLTLSIVFVLTKDFVVPQMALENISAFEGWRRLWPMMKAEKGSYVVYILMKIVMAIGAGIVIGIAIAILILFVMIPVVGLGIVAAITSKGAGLTWDAFTITMVVVAGCAVVAFLLYLMAMISVPIIVFFPAYAIYFFAARYPQLSAALYPVPAAVAPQVPPTDLPPLAPLPAPAG